MNALEGKGGTLEKCILGKEKRNQKVSLRGQRCQRPYWDKGALYGLVSSETNWEEPLLKPWSLHVSNESINTNHMGSW